MKKKFQDIRISVVYLASEDVIATSPTLSIAMGEDVDEDDYDYQAPTRIFH